MRRSIASLSVLALLSALLVAVFAASPAGAAPLPGQIVRVQTSSPTATRGTITRYALQRNLTYAQVGTIDTAYVGELGVGIAREGISRTPAGQFTLTQAFGNQPSNGTALPYFQASRADWWDGESGTPAYNTHVHQVASPGPSSENLYDAGAVYAHAVVIDYNRFPAVAGRGSAFFLHVTNGQPTAGCVAVASSVLDTIMRWLSPAQHPIISIGVGAAANAPITAAYQAALIHNPFGYLDSVTAVGGGNVAVRGWAADPDNRSARLPIHVYADGRIVGIYSTGVARPDVARVMRTGPYQGYAMTVHLAAGRHTVCTYALNIAVGTVNPQLGCKVVAVR
jgi:L,D-peptidoglycan transpeptidase YkuD (ErfK/YbiS/YcfS/YnhG family)